MAASTEERTGAFDARDLDAKRCPDCEGTGELRFDIFEDHGHGARKAA